MLQFKMGKKIKLLQDKEILYLPELGQFVQGSYLGGCKHPPKA